MNPIIKIMERSWEQTGKSDNERLAKQSEPESVEQINNIAYIKDGDNYHLLDMYYPKGTKKKLPVIIDIHGGGWMYGDKDLNKIYCLNLAKRGFVVFNISYRLYPNATVIEQLQDCALALRWISENLKDYPCDKNNIMLTGDSAGGQLSAYSAALLTDEKLRQVFNVVDGKIKLTALMLTSPVAFMKNGGLISIYTKLMWGDNFKGKATYGYMDIDELLNTACLPPTVLITSSGDSLAREQTRRLAALLEEKGTETKLMDFDKFFGVDLPHVFPVVEPESVAGSLAIDGGINFFLSQIEKKKIKK